MGLFIATLDEIKTLAGLTDAVDDAELILRAEALQGRIEDHCRRKLERAVDEVEYFDGGARALWLKRFPVESAVVYVDADQEWDSQSLVDTSGYRLIGDRGKIVRGLNGLLFWESGVQNIKVIYTGGFAAAGSVPGAGQTAMPEGLRRGFLMQMDFEWRNRRTLGLSQVSGNNVTIQQGAQVSLALKGQTFLPEVETTLAPYVRYA